MRAVEDCITTHVDRDALSRTKAIEESERETLRSIALEFVREGDPDF
jgi:hypothetical protein